LIFFNILYLTVSRVGLLLTAGFQHVQGQSHGYRSMEQKLKWDCNAGNKEWDH